MFDRVVPNTLLALVLIASPGLRMEQAQAEINFRSIAPQSTIAQAPENWAAARLIYTLPEAYPAPGTGNTVVISPDNSMAAVVVHAGENTDVQQVKLWDLNTGKLRHTFSGYPWLITAIVFSPDGKTLATGDYDHPKQMMTIKLWNVSTGKLVRTLRRSQAPKPYSGGSYYFPVSLAFSPDGQTLYTSATNPVVQVWDLNTGRLQRSLSVHPQTVRSIAVSPNGGTIALNYVDGRLDLVDARTGSLKQTLESKEIFTAWFTPEGNLHGVLDQYPRQRGVRLYRPDGSVLLTRAGFPWDAWIETTPNGRVAAVSNFSTGLQFYDLQTGKVMQTIGDFTTNYAFSPDGKTLVAQTKDGIKVWR